MNAQRWIAVGFLGLIALCVASSSLWLPALGLFGDDEETAEATETPDAEVAEAEGTAESDDGENDDADEGDEGEEGEEGEEDEAQPTPTEADMTATIEPTLDPAVAEMLTDLEVEELGPGIDPHITRAGDFTTVDPMHRADGTASLYQLSDTQRVLRLDPFEVTNGPDLKVILSENEAPRTSTETMLPTHLDLGNLKSPNGAQNYPVPEGEDLEKYRSVVIYSMSLNIVYSSAPLTDVRGGGG